MRWYEHLLGILAMIDCVLLVLFAAMFTLSGRISRQEEKEWGEW